MQESILQIVILLSIAIATACLEMYFQFIQDEGQILEPYRKVWLHYRRYKTLLKKYGRTNPFVFFMAYISKPMSLCCYCNGTWLSIIVYTIGFGFNWGIFLFIGVTWLFIRIMDKYHLL